MLIRWSEVYANTEILSPIDYQTWQVIGETSKLACSSKVIELASGKGAFANFLAKSFRCSVDAFDSNPEFVDYSNKRARELGLDSRVKFTEVDINQLEVPSKTYDLGACLGAIYIFRENGWKVLSRAVKPSGYLAVSDLVCKRVPAPKELADVYFEEADQSLTREDARRWYTDRGATILREETCSLKAWLEYYDLTRKMLLQVSKKHPSDRKLEVEVEEGLREDGLFRKYGEEYIEYVTFILKIRR